MDVTLSNGAEKPNRRASSKRNLSPSFRSRVHVSTCQSPGPALTRPGCANEATTARCRAQLRLVRSSAQGPPQSLLSPSGGLPGATTELWAVLCRVCFFVRSWCRWGCFGSETLELCFMFCVLCLFFCFQAAERRQDSPRRMSRAGCNGTPEAVSAR